MLIVDGTRITQELYDYMAKNRMLRITAEFEPTIGEIIEYRKARGSSYEEAIKQLTQLRKL